jgi:hypothetical protein
MRYYVVCDSDHRGVDSYIVAEVVRDRMGDDRETTLASALAGQRAHIVTREELLANSAGSLALNALEASNDEEFDRESDAIMSECEITHRHLRSVPLQRHP